MKSAEDIFVLPGQESPEAWRAKGRESATKQDSGKVKSAGWIALPMRSVLSVPMRFPAMSADRREAAALLELEGAGIEAAPTDFQTEARDNDQHDHRAWTVVQTGQMPPQALNAQLDAHFAPSVSFQTLKRGEARLWEEGQRLTVAIPDEQGRPLHAQALTSTLPDEDAAAELRCIFGSLDLAGISPEVEKVTLVQPPEAAVAEQSLTAFITNLELPLTTQAPEAPHLPRESWRLVPPVIIQKRHKRTQQQTLMLAAAGCVLVLMALLGAYAARLWTRERALSGEDTRLTALEPELQVIRDAKTRWQVMEDAITPDKSAMEIFHQIATLLPPEGVRLEVFEVRDSHIIVQGETANLGLFNQFREDLTRLPAFSDLVWEIPNPEIQPNGTARFRAEARPPDTEETPTSA